MTPRAPDRPANRAAPDVLTQLVAWRDAGDAVALATVIETWGSSPRRPGSQLAVARDGRFEGSVSGGCVEGAVVLAAQRAIASKTHELLDFGVTDELAWEVGLACGGEMRVLVEPVAARGAAGSSWLDGLQARRAAKQPVVATVDLSSGVRAVLDRESRDDARDPALAEAIRDALRGDLCGVVGDDRAGLFVQPFNPPLRLVVVGAVHIAQPLVEMAALAGYEVVVVDPRGAFATGARFPGVSLWSDWPDEALEALALDARSAVVTLTHDPKLDDPALSVALRSKAFYVGSLGSRRTQARRLERLRALGVEESALARIHGPVGLDIGALSPAEIAVSILAQITAVLRRAQ